MQCAAKATRDTGRENNGRGSSSISKQIHLNVHPAAITIFVCSSNRWMAGNFVEARKKPSMHSVELQWHIHDKMRTAKCKMQNQKLDVSISDKCAQTSPHIKTMRIQQPAFNCIEDSSRETCTAGRTKSWPNANDISYCLWLWFWLACGIWLTSLGVFDLVFHYTRRNVMCNAVHTLSCNVERTNR